MTWTKKKTEKEAEAVHWLELDVTNVEMIERFFGDKTINKLRLEHDLPEIIGGEQLYAAWYKEHANALPHPKLKVVANPFLPTHV